MIQPNKMPEQGQDAARPENDEAKAERFLRLNALGASLARTRKDAMDARRASGIEDIWREDEEHYESIDELNQGERSNWDSKPVGQARPKLPGAASTLFTNITRPYVDAAAAKVGDILLPTDERAWSLTETPIPELIEKANGLLPAEVTQGMARDLPQAGLAPEQVQGVQQQVQAVEAQAAAKMLADAKEKAKKAEKRIEDWHIEGQFHAEMRKLIEDCTRIGSGVLKGPIPVAKKHQMYKEGAIVMVEEIKPVSKRIDPWNFFPDGACGESIHNGNYVWERDYITKKQLRALKSGEGYIAEQIDLCLEEGPHQRTEVRKTAEGHVLDDKDLYEIWYFTGQASSEDMEAAGCKCKEGASIPAVVTMINDRVIKAALNHLDTGDFPYDVMPWQRRKNMPWGYGVARQIRTPQLIVLAGVRTMLTNAGRSAGPVFVRMGKLTGLHGNDNIEPWAQFQMDDSDGVNDARAAFAMFEIPDRYQSLMGIVQFGMKLAEDVTGLPLLLQGQAGSAPETLGGQQLVDRNASGTLRRIARTVDDCITEPHIRRYYAYLLQYGEDDEKGEFVIDARGSTYLVEQDIYKQELAQDLQASLNPAFELSPAKVMREYLRARKRNPDAVMLSEEEKAAAAKQQQGPPPDPALEVAKVRQATEMDKVKANQEAEKADREAKAQEAQLQRQHDLEIENIRFQTAMMKLSESRGMSFEKIKADLAKTTMTLNTTRELSRNQARAKNMPKPPVEPAGRAPTGQSFPK